MVQTLNWEKLPKSVECHLRKQMRRGFIFYFTQSIREKIQYSQKLRKQCESTFSKKQFFSLRGGGNICSINNQNIQQPKPIRQSHDLQLIKYVLDNFINHSEQIQIASDQTSNQNYKEQILKHLQWFRMMNLTFIQYWDKIKFQTYTDVYFSLMLSSNKVAEKDFMLGLEILKIANNFLPAIVYLLGSDCKKNQLHNEKQQIVQTSINILLKYIYDNEVKFQILLLNKLSIFFQSDQLQDQLINIAIEVLKSVITFQISGELINSFIEIGKSIYNIIKSQDQGALEIFTFFQRIQMMIMEMLTDKKQTLQAEDILKILHSIQEKMVINSQSWILNLCWIRLISFLISTYPVLYQGEMNQSDWDQLISNEVKIKKSSFNELVWFVPKVSVPYFSQELRKYEDLFKKLHQFQLVLLKRLKKTSSQYFIIDSQIDQQQIIHFFEYLVQKDLTNQNKEILFRQSLNQYDRITERTGEKKFSHEQYENIQELKGCMFQVLILIINQQDIVNWQWRRTKLFVSCLQISNNGKILQQELNKTYSELKQQFKLEQEEFHKQFDQFQENRLILIRELIKHEENIFLNNLQDQSQNALLEKALETVKKEIQKFKSFFDKNWFEKFEQFQQQVKTLFSNQIFLLKFNRSPFHLFHRLIKKFLFFGGLYQLMITITEMNNIPKQQIQLIDEVIFLLKENQLRVNFFRSFMEEQLIAFHFDDISNFKKEKEEINKKLNECLQILEKLQGSFETWLDTINEENFSNSKTLLDLKNQIIIYKTIQEKKLNFRNSTQINTHAEKIFAVLLYFVDQILNEQILKVINLFFQLQVEPEPESNSKLILKICYVFNLFWIIYQEKKIDINSQLSQFCQNQLYQIKFEEKDPTIQLIIKNTENDDPNRRYVAVQLRNMKEKKYYELIGIYYDKVNKINRMNFFCQVNCSDKNNQSRNATRKIFKFLKNQYKHVLLIKGKSGIGKTSLVKYIQSLIIEKDVNWIPLLIQLDKIKRPTTDLLNESLQLLSKNEQETRAILEEVKDRKIKLLLILDGFDKMNLEKRKNLIIENQLIPFIVDGGLKIIITTRTYFFNQNFQESLFKHRDYICTHIEISELNSLQKELFIEEIVKQIFFKKLFFWQQENCQQKQKQNYQDFVEQISKILSDASNIKQLQNIKNTTQIRSNNEDQQFHYFEQRQVNTLIQVFFENTVFGNLAEQKRTSLEGLLKSIWSPIKFRKVILSSQLSNLLSTPFMFKVFKKLFCIGISNKNVVNHDIFDSQNFQQMSEYRKFDFFIELYNVKCSKFNSQPHSFKMGLENISQNFALQLALNKELKGIYQKKGNEIQGQFHDEVEENMQYIQLVRSILWGKQQLDKNPSQLEFSHDSIRVYFLGKYLLTFIEQIVPIKNDSFSKALKDSKWNENKINLSRPVDQEFQEFCEKIHKSEFNKQNFNISESYFQSALNLIRDELKQIYKLKQRLLQVVRLSTFDDTFIRASSNSLYLLYFLKYLEYEKLKGIKISDINLSGANFNGSDLQMSKFFNVVIDGCNFSEANLSFIDWLVVFKNESNIFSSNGAEKMLIYPQPEYLILGCKDQSINLFDIQKGSFIEVDKVKRGLHSKYQGLSLSLLDSKDLLTKLYSNMKEQPPNEKEILNITFSQNTNIIAVCKKNSIQIFKAPSWTRSTIQIRNVRFSSDTKICFSDYKYLCFNCFYDDNENEENDLSNQEQIILWNLENNEIIKKIYDYFLAFTISNELLFIRGELKGINTIEITDRKVEVQPLQHQIRREIKKQNFAYKRKKYLQLMILSSDNKFLCFFQEDLTLYLWSIKNDTISLYSSFKGFSSKDSDIMISPQNNFIVAFSMNKSIIKIWNIEKKQEPPIFENISKSKQIDQFVTSSDSKIIAISYQDYCIRIYLIESGVLLAEYTEHSAQINKIIFSPSCNALLSYCACKKLKVWNIQNKMVTFSKELSSEIIDLKFCTEKKIILQNNHFSYKFLDYRNNTELCFEFSHPFILIFSNLERVSLSSTGSFISLKTHDQSINLFQKNGKNKVYKEVEFAAFTFDENYYCTFSGKCFQQYQLNQKDDQQKDKIKNIMKFNYFPCNNSILLTDSNGQSSIFLLSESSKLIELQQLNAQRSIVNQIKFSLDYQYFAIFYFQNNNWIEIWKVDDDSTQEESKYAKQMINQSFYQVTDVYFSPKCEYVILIGQDFNQIINLKTLEMKQFICNLQEDQLVKTGILFTKDIEQSFYQYFHSQFKVQYIEVDINNIPDKNQQFTISEVINSPTSINQCLVCSDQSLLVVVYDKKIIKLWGKKERLLEGHTSDINQIKFTPDNKILVSTEPNLIILWSLEQGEKIGYYLGFDCIEISLTCQILLAKSQANSYLIWNFLQLRCCNYESQLFCEKDDIFYVSAQKCLFKICEGNEEKMFLSHHNQSQLTLSLNKQFLASYDDNEIKIWDTTKSKDPELIQILKMEKVNFVVFSPEDSIIAYSTLDAKLALWNFRNDKSNTLKNLNSKQIIFKLLFSDDGTNLISRSTMEISVWDIKLMILYYIIDIQDTMSIEISPNGKLIGFTCDNNIKLWDIQQQEEIGRYEVLIDRVQKLCFSANSKVLLFQVNDEERIQCLNVEQQRSDIIKVQKNGRTIPFWYKQYNLKIIGSSNLLAAKDSMIFGSKIQTVSGISLKNTFLQKGAKEYNLNVKKLPTQQDLVDYYLMQEQVQEISIENMKNTIIQNLFFFKNYVSEMIEKLNGSGDTVTQINIKISEMKYKMKELVNNFIESEPLKLQQIRIYFNEFDEYFFFLTLQKQDAEFKLKIFMLDEWETKNNEILETFKTQKIKFKGVVYIVQCNHTMIKDFGEISLAVWYHLVQKKSYTIEQGLKILSSTIAPYYILYMKQY